MLSLEACRKILGEDAPADDSQVEKQRDAAYHLARLLMEIYCSEKSRNSKISMENEHKMA